MVACVCIAWCFIYWFIWVKKIVVGVVVGVESVDQGWPSCQDGKC